MLDMRQVLAVWRESRRVAHDADPPVNLNSKRGLARPHVQPDAV